jgi:hypothetical protein
VDTTPCDNFSVANELQLNLKDTILPSRLVIAPERS